MLLLHSLILLFTITLFSLLPAVQSASLTLHLPPNLPPLHPSTRALLITTGITESAPVTRTNAFVFRNLTIAGVYSLDIGCRDWNFAPMVVEVRKGKRGAGVGIEVRRKGGGEVKRLEGDGWEARVLGARDGWEERGGFSPLSLLKNPMILIGVLGFAFVIGMPYLLDNMDPETRKEFEEQQKNSILNTGAAGGNPLQNFDMAAWMAGKTAGGSGAGRGSSSGREGEAKPEGGQRSRRRG